MQIAVSLEKNLCPAFDLQAQTLYCSKHTQICFAPRISPLPNVSNPKLKYFAYLYVSASPFSWGLQKTEGGLQPSLPLPFYFVSNFAKNRVPPFAESFRPCSLSDSQRSANTCKGLPVLSALIGRKCHLKAELIVVTGRCLASEWARGSREGVSTAESRI